MENQQFKPKITNFENIFSKMFSNVILQNEIVSTILYVVNMKLKVLKEKIDKQFNTDI